MAYELLHFFKRTWAELKRLNKVYGRNYSNACIKCMKQIVRWLEREIQLHEKKKKTTRKRTEKRPQNKVSD